jgi:hypothetical protein
VYDYHILAPDHSFSNATPPDPGWRRALLGDDFSHQVMAVVFCRDRVDSQGKLVRCLPTITDADMVCLEPLTAIRSLDLSYSQVGDTGLEHVAHLTDLEKLELRGTKVTNDGLRHLFRLAKLEYLGLEGTSIGDPGLEHLPGLERLSLVNLTGTNATPQGVATLHRTLPWTCIQFKP